MRTQNVYAHETVPMNEKSSREKKIRKHMYIHTFVHFAAVSRLLMCKLHTLFT